MTQREALEILKLGHNIYLTGSAGSGKTYLLNQYIRHLKDLSVSIGVTASTGIAASHIDGITIHSWSGLGIRDNVTAKDLADIVKKGRVKKRLQKAKVLIIDEISMLDACRFDAIDTICRRLRGNALPFGGLQVIICGDFFQLPPVRIGEKEIEFVMASQAWHDLDLKVCYLTEQFRHNDKKFIKVLNDIRTGEVTQSTRQLLEDRRLQPLGKNVVATKLYTHNANVDVINEAHLNKIRALHKKYTMEISGRSALAKELQKFCLARGELILKVGAAVMFIRNNFEAGYTNGTLGEVVAFDDSNDYPIVRTKTGQLIFAKPETWVVEENGEVLASIKQVPLRLAWAITVHKSQGMSLDAAEIDLSKSFELGMGYVALSRVKALSGIKLLGINEMAYQVNPQIIEFDRTLMEMSEEVRMELQQMDDEAKDDMQQDFLKILLGGTARGMTHKIDF